MMTKAEIKEVATKIVNGMSAEAKTHFAAGNVPVAVSLAILEGSETVDDMNDTMAEIEALLSF